jgi:succinyl-diaminopimelate desuccinylase
VTDEAVRLCSELVRCRSVSGPGAEVECAALLERLLADSGFDCEVVSLEPGRPNLICRAASGRPGPSLLLTGHLDVVGAGPAEEWQLEPFGGAVRDGAVWGRGSADMKGAVAAMTAAARLVRGRGGPECGELVLAFTADEEGTGRWGLPALVESGLIAADAAVVGEPCGVAADFEFVGLATRGFALVGIEVETAGGHSSLYDTARPHAVAVACALQRELERSFRPSPLEHPVFPGGPTVVAGTLIEGGEHYGVLPPRARLGLEARLLPGAEPERFLDELRAFLSPLVPEGVRIAIELERDGWGDAVALDPSHPLARSALTQVQAAGYVDAEFGGMLGFSEGAFLAGAGIPCLTALGPGRLDRAHRANERVETAAITAAVGIYAGLVDDLLRPA